MRTYQTSVTAVAAMAIVIGLTALPECGWLPNCVNTGSANTAVQPLAASLEQWRALKLWLAQQPDWTIIVADGDFLQLTTTTPTLGFTDDVQLLFIPSQQLIQVRSSSRLGISDMGTNARRVETLRKQLRDLP